MGRIDKGQSLWVGDFSIKDVDFPLKVIDPLGHFTAHLQGSGTHSSFQDTFTLYSMPSKGPE